MAKKQINIDVKVTNADAVEQLTTDLNELNSVIQDVIESEGELTEAQKALLESIDTAKLEKAEEALKLMGEAAALGFNSLDYGASTIEGLNVAIGALNASLGEAKDEFERANIETEIKKIEAAIELAEAKAKQGIFPKGSIGAITNEVELLELQLRALPAGTDEFNKVKKRFDELNQNLEVLQLSAEDKKQVFFDLGASIGGTIAGTAGAFAALGAENEELNAALVKIQGALAAVEAVRSLSDTLRLARQAKSIALTNAEAAAQANLAGASTATASAQTAAGGASNFLSKGIKGIGQAIKANPILFIASILIAVGTAAIALKDKFEPLRIAVDAIGDAVNGLIGGFKALFSGEDFTEGFTKGVEKGNKERELNTKETLNTILNTESSNEQRRLALIGGNEAKISKLKQDSLARDRDLAGARLQNELDLTNAELEILKGGDAEKIIELKKTLQERGDLTEETVEQLNKIEESSLAIKEEQAAESKRIADEQKAQYVEAVDAALSRFNSEKDLEASRLADKKDKQSKIRLVEIELEKQLEGFRVARLKGEKVLESDIQKVKEESARKKAKIEEDLLKSRKDTQDKILQQEVDFLKSDYELAEDGSLKKKDLAEETADELAAIQLETNDEIKKLNEETAKKLEEDAENSENILKEAEERKNKILLDGALERKDVEDRIQADKDKKAEDEQKLLDENLAKEKERNNIKLQLLESELNLAKNVADNEKLSISERVKAKQEAYNIEKDLIEQKAKSEILNLGLTEAQYKDLIANGLDVLLQKYPKISKEVGQLAENTVESAKQQKDALGDIPNATAESVQLGASKASEALKQVAEIANGLVELTNELTDAIVGSQIEGIEAEQAALEESSAAATAAFSEQMEGLEKETEERADNIASLEEGLAELSGEERERALAQIEEEKAKQLEADMFKADLAAKETLRKEEEAKQAEELAKKKRKLERDAAIVKKVTSVITAIINGALAVSQALAGSSPPVNFILAGISAALAGVQVGTIIAQPLPPLAKGGFTKRSKNNLEPAGLVHANEWVAPAWMTKSHKYSPIISRLESGRVKGYADGGFVSPTDAQDNITSAVSGSIGKIPNTVVDVKEVIKSSSKVTQVESRATL